MSLILDDPTPALACSGCGKVPARHDDVFVLRARRWWCSRCDRANAQADADRAAELAEQALREYAQERE